MTAQEALGAALVASGFYLTLQAADGPAALLMFYLERAGWQLAPLEPVEVDP